MEPIRTIDESDLNAISLAIAGALSAMTSWFDDTAWELFFEVRPTGWGLSMYRTDATVAQCVLRGDSDPYQLACQLLTKTQNFHRYVDARTTDGAEACEHCDGEESPMAREDHIRGWVCPVCDEALDLDDEVDGDCACDFDGCTARANQSRDEGAAGTFYLCTQHAVEFDEHVVETWSERHLDDDAGSYKVGDRYTVDLASGPGRGRKVYEVTRVDANGVHGVLVSSTARELTEGDVR